LLAQVPAEYREKAFAICAGQCEFDVYEFVRKLAGIVKIKSWLDWQDEERRLEDERAQQKLAQMAIDNLLDPRTEEERCADWYQDGWEATHEDLIAGLHN